MSHRLEVIANVLAECLNYILVAAIETILFLNFIKMWPEMWRIMVLMIVPVFFYFLREKCGNVLLFFAGHILPVVFVAARFGNSIYERVMMALGLFLFAMMSIRKQLYDGDDKGIEAVSVIAASGTFLGLYLLDGAAGKGEASLYLIQLVFVYLVGYFLYDYVTGFLNYIDMNNRTAEHIPERRAFGVSFGMATAFTVGSLLFTFLITNKDLIEKVGAGIRNVIVSIIRFLASLLPDYEPGEIEIQRTTQIQGEGVILPSGETSWFVQIIDVILTLFAFGVIAFFIGSLAMTLYRLVKNASWGGQTAKVREENEAKDKIESLFAIRKKRKKTEKEAGFFAPKTCSQQIRRIYHRTLWQKYKVLKEEKTAKLIKESTPRECCRQLFADQKEQALLFASLYEKARYAGEQCSKQEVGQMKACADALLGKR